MSLSRALSTLSPDEHTERVIRDVLTLFGHHAREWLTEADIRNRTGLTSLELRPVLSAFSGAYVLESDGDAERYRYNGDVCLKFEIDAFMRRVDFQQSHVRSNVARFRERQGY